MSGGHFCYSYYGLDDVALEIADVVYKNKKHKRYSQETINEFNNAIDALRMAHAYAKRVDWLLSDDDSEETFHEQLKKDLQEIKKA